jgi:uncharacterized membrane protein YciS (DUF1049 family)
MQQNNDQQNEDNDIYRIGRFTLLQLMSVLGTLGILMTWILHHFLDVA